MAALDLRPLSLGELLDRTFFLYRRHFLLFLGIAAVPYLLVLIPVLVGLLLYGLPGRSQVPSSIMAVAAVVGAVAARPNRPEPGFDVEAFLRNVYLSQE